MDFSENRRYTLKDLAVVADGLDLDLNEGASLIPVYFSRGAERQARVAAIHEVEDHLQEQIKALDVIQSKIFTSIRVLELRRAEASNALLAVNSLPPEVLGEIFMMAIEPADDIFVDDSPSSAFRFSHVSSYWRDVALGCSPLWSRANLSAFAGRPDRAYVDTWLSRARTTPLRLCIDASGFPSDSTGSIRLLGTALQRVMSLHVMIQHARIRDFLIPHASISFLKLEVLHITLGRNAEHRYNWGWDVPSLRDFKLVDKRSQPPDTIPFHMLRFQLQSLYLEGGRSQPVPMIEALMRCTLLRCLTLNGVTIQAPRTQSAPRQIPNIVELHIGPSYADDHVNDGSGDIVLDATMRHFTFANLQTLGLHIDTFTGESIKCIKDIVSGPHTDKHLFPPDVYPATPKISHSKRLEHLRLLSSPTRIATLFGLLSRHQPRGEPRAIIPTHLQSLQVFTSRPPVVGEITLASKFQDLIQEIWEDKQTLQPPELLVPELHVSDALLPDDRHWYEEKVGKLVVISHTAFSRLGFVAGDPVDGWD